MSLRTTDDLAAVDEDGTESRQLAESMRGLLLSFTTAAEEAGGNAPRVI